MVSTSLQNVHKHDVARIVNLFFHDVPRHRLRLSPIFYNMFTSPKLKILPNCYKIIRNCRKQSCRRLHFPAVPLDQIPVIFLTARGDLPSKVKGLTDGAEDYMVKPFEMLELLVRVEKVLRRFQKKEEDCHRIRDVEIFPKERIVRKAGTVIPFKPMEFDCLMLLVKYKNIALGREQLLRMLWGVEFEGETRTIDVHIGRIRKKLGFQDVIKTVPRIGYRLEDRTDGKGDALIQEEP